MKCRLLSVLEGGCLPLLLAVFGSVAQPANAAPALPIGIIESDTAHDRWLRKPVIESRLLDGMEQTNDWSHHGQGAIELTAQRVRQGRQALRLVSPTLTEKPNRVTGRPFGEAVARRAFAREDWSAFNRVSFWVYPDLPGFKVVSLMVRLGNAGSERLSYTAGPMHFFLLKNGQWNPVVWEIPHLTRDQVTHLDFVYRLQGHEPSATNLVCFELDQLELQRVEADHFEGWNVAPGRLAYSHSGYALRGPKIALATGLSVSNAVLRNARANRPVLVRPAVYPANTDLGEFQVIDFSGLREPGTYVLSAGPLETRPFRIGEDVWRDSIWKTVNFFYTERCGDAVAGIHDVCHQDWQAVHGESRRVINGGWHDAGDLSQGLVNTAEATYAMLDLAGRLPTADAALSDRLRTEARWGLEWMLKTRFGDGYRVTWATMDYWTDGRFGNVDDTLGNVNHSPFDNYLAVATEAKGWRVLRTAAPALAEKALAAAREDWQFAVEKHRSSSLEVTAAGAQASLELFLATREQRYADKAVELAKVILRCQQREYPAWEVPLTGFYYANPNRDRIVHYNHRSHEQAPVVALAGLCEAFPDHPDWIQWYSAIVLYAEYLKQISRFTQPYGVFPASIYRLDERPDQVAKGIRLGDHHYLRRFPVWDDFRGHFGVLLSQTKALATASRLRRDPTGGYLCQGQLQWVVGLNPFAQSTMFGEGHDYAPQYTAMSGDLVGSLPVGIQTRGPEDTPYWPASNCYNYKEVWVHPSSRWLAIMRDLLDVEPEGVKPGVLKSLSQQTAAGGQVTIQAQIAGAGKYRLELRASNLDVPEPARSVTLEAAQTERLVWNSRMISTNEPWVAVVLIDGKTAPHGEILGNFRSAPASTNSM